MVEFTPAISSGKMEIAIIDVNAIVIYVGINLNNSIWI